MYRGKKSWLQIIYGVILLGYVLCIIANSLGLIRIFPPNININYIPLLVLLFLSLQLLIINIKKGWLKIYIENDIIVLENYFKRKEINLSSIREIKYKSDYSYVLLSSSSTTIRVPLDLINSSMFLTELYNKLENYLDKTDENKNIFLTAKMKRTFKDHQYQRFHSYLWITLIITPITFLLATWLSHSLEFINVIRIIILLVLPIVIILLPEVHFANSLEKQFLYQNKIMPERNNNFEINIYKKYFSLGIIIFTAVISTYLLY